MLLTPTSLVKPAALQQLKTGTSQFSISIAIITDTWFTAQHTGQLVKIDGYKLYRNDHVGKKGGGVTIYVRDNVNSAVKMYPESCSMLNEVLWVECTYIDTLYYIAACYHPPRAR
jgi:hypothetical protein